MVMQSPCKELAQGDIVIRLHKCCCFGIEVWGLRAGLGFEVWRCEERYGSKCFDRDAHCEMKNMF